jgi:hypothetical protein
VLAGVVRSAIEERFDLDRYRLQVVAEERDRTALYRALPQGAEA